MMEIRKELPAIHPGEHLQIDLEEAGVSQAQSARELRVPRNRISLLMRGERSITADTALRLARWMGTTREYWLNLQTNYDLRVAIQEHGDVINRTITPRDPSIA